MPVPQKLIDQIGDYEKQGYSPDEIISGIEQSPAYKDVASQIATHRSSGYKGTEILTGLKSSPVKRGVVDRFSRWVTPDIQGAIGEGGTEASQAGLSTLT